MTHAGFNWSKLDFRFQNCPWLTNLTKIWKRKWGKQSVHFLMTSTVFLVRKNCPSDFELLPARSDYWTEHKIHIFMFYFTRCWHSINEMLQLNRQMKLFCSSLCLSQKFVECYGEGSKTSLMKYFSRTKTLLVAEVGAWRGCPKTLNRKVFNLYKWRWFIIQGKSKIYLGQLKLNWN